VRYKALLGAPDIHPFLAVEHRHVYLTQCCDQLGAGWERFE